MQTDTFLDEIEQTTQLDGAADFLLDRWARRSPTVRSETCSRASGSDIRSIRCSPTSRSGSGHRVSSTSPRRSQDRRRPTRFLGLGAISAVPTTLAGLTDTSAIEDPPGTPSRRRAATMATAAPGDVRGCRGVLDTTAARGRGVMWSLAGQLASRPLRGCSRRQPRRLRRRSANRTVAIDCFESWSKGDLGTTRTLVARTSLLRRASLRRTAAASGVSRAGAARALRRRGARGLVRVRRRGPRDRRAPRHAALALPSRTSLLGVVDPSPNQSDERADRDESTTQDQGRGGSLSLRVLRRERCA